MPSSHFAQTTDFAFIDDLMSFGESYEAQPGDTVELMAEKKGDLEGSATVVEPGSNGRRVRMQDTGEVVDVGADAWMYLEDSPAIGDMWQSHLDREHPDGVAFADGIVDAALDNRLRADVQRLKELEPVDYHPGSGTRVRDLVHPSLFPYIVGRSVLSRPMTVPESPKYDRFGRLFEASSYQWLPTPFAIAPDGGVTIASYINNLDRARHGAAYESLAALFSTALPLIESVVGYVSNTSFFRQGAADIEDESELPDSADRARQPASPRSLRGRELLVIPKIVEYRLGAGESHEGVWHVEGMSHEHIVATCLYVLDRDEALEGGDLSFKRAYTVEEAGHLFWHVDQVRPAAINDMVDEGTVPVGSVATPAGRMVVFPNSHIHKLGKLSLQAGATQGFRRVIVFWIVDPDATIPSTREVAPQQAAMPRDEALAIRLKLMEERKRHKETFNVRAVSLCEH